MNANTLIKPNGAQISSTLIRESVNTIATSILSDVENVKALALRFRELRDSPDLKAEFPSMDFKGVIDYLFSPYYTGNTAYKYAQCADLYTPIPEIWETFTMSKMIVTSSLESKSSKEKGMSTINFIEWVGVRINQGVADKHTNWMVENADLLDSIELFRNAGKDTASLESRLTPEPARPIVWREGMTEEERESSIREFQRLGTAVIVSSTDKALKEMVKAYKATFDGTQEAPPEDDNTPEDGNTPADLLGDAYNALLAYVSTLDKVPTDYRKTIDRLKAEIDNR